MFRGAYNAAEWLQENDPEMFRKVQEAQRREADKRRRRMQQRRLPKKEHGTPEYRAWLRNRYPDAFPADEEFEEAVKRGRGLKHGGEPKMSSIQLQKRGDDKVRWLSWMIVGDQFAVLICGMCTSGTVAFVIGEGDHGEPIIVCQDCIEELRKKEG